MNSFLARSGNALPAVLLITLAICRAPAAATEFVAPYVQTVEEDVELILNLAGVTAQDYLIDLGSGDGRFVIAAAKRGAMAHGVELDAELVELATKNAMQARVTERAAFLQGDIFTADISAASVVTLYLFPEANIKLRPKLLAELRPGTRVVSNSFHMGEWLPDKRAQGRTSGGALLWFVPADVAGQWQLSLGSDSFSFVLEQQFQQISWGESNTPNELQLSEIQLQGVDIRFAGQVGDQAYLFNGQVTGDAMSGVVHDLDEDKKEVASWRAHRVKG